MTDRERAIREAIREVRGKRVEHVIILDADGVEVWRGVGTKKQVARPTADYRGRTIVHNHPSGGSLSFQDVKNAANDELWEMIAVADDYVYRLELTPSAPFTMPRHLRDYLNAEGPNSETHERWTYILGFWPQVRYRRQAISEHGASFIAGPLGLEEAL